MVEIEPKKWLTNKTDCSIFRTRAYYYVETMWNVEKGNHFKQLRRRAGFSQIDLANAMGYSTKQAIFYVESGRQEPTPKFRIKALECFRERIPNINLSDIFIE